MTRANLMVVKALVYKDICTALRQQCRPVVLSSTVKLELTPGRKRKTGFDGSDVIKPTNPDTGRQCCRLVWLLKSRERDQRLMT